MEKNQKSLKPDSSNCQVHTRVPSIRKCCWCGELKIKSRGKSCMLSAPGIGRRYYWNCGCLDSYNFNEFTELLFVEGLDYPKVFKKV